MLTDAARKYPQVDWEFHDDQGDRVVAARVAAGVVTGGYAAVIGHFNSLGARDSLPLYREAGLPVVLPLSTRPGLVDGYPNAVQWCPDDLDQVAALRLAAATQGVKKLGVRHDGTDYGRGMAELFDADDDQDGDGLVVCGTHHGSAVVAREIRSEGYAGPLFFTDDCAVEEFAELAGEAAEGAKVVRLAGGAQGFVDGAFAALVMALRENDIVAAVNREKSRSGWEVVAVERVPHYDVVVVGAGVVGAATASALVQAGVSVAVCAPADDVESATRYSGGLVRAYEHDGELRRLAIRSHLLLWRESPHFRRTGSLVLLGPEHLADAVAGVQDLTAAGIEAELLDADELRRDFDLHAAGAVWEPGGGYASPPVVARALIEDVTRHDAKVQRLETDTRGTRLVTSAGTLTARTVVIAAGGGTPELVDVGPARMKRIRYAFFDRGGRELPTVVDLRTGIWGRPVLDGPYAGGFLAGRPVDEWDVGLDGGDQLTDDQVTHIREGVRQLWPWLGDAAHLGGRYGADLFADGPVVGPVGDVVVAACWAGGGFKTAPAAGEQAAFAALKALTG
ncbi:MAG: FAD-dependent oxidoreductase [Saccharothrix sp.]|nr:FAD-dependent oxidoreductase [Saccharothrix sp.]